MIRKWWAVAGAITLLSVPLLVAAVERVAYHLHHRNNGTIVTSGQEREYLLYVPSSYDAATPTPLVITFHGGALRPTVQRDMSHWNDVADRHGFLVVYPAGLRFGGDGPRGWRVTEEGPNLATDVQFVEDLIEKLQSTYNIDPSRIYANGLSNGGAMTFVVSCKMPDRFAAFGLVAAAQWLSHDWCPDDRPAPMISFHGTEDTAVPYEGGTTWVGPFTFPDVSQWTASWASRNGCAHEPVETTVAYDVTRGEYTNCTNDASVVLFTIKEGGHTWPGGEPAPEWFLGRTSDSIDASRLMWSFFERHRLATESHDDR